MAEIEFRGVSFLYPGCERKALDQVDLKIEPHNLLYCAANPAAERAPFSGR
ncbi:MAG: hypothetical protein ACLRXC_11410 [[Clostridium] leptum]